MLYLTIRWGRTIVTNAVSDGEAAHQAGLELGLRADQCGIEDFERIVEIPTPEPGQCAELKDVNWGQ